MTETTRCFCESLVESSVDLWFRFAKTFPTLVRNQWTREQVWTTKQRGCVIDRTLVQVTKLFTWWWSCNPEPPSGSSPNKSVATLWRHFLMPGNLRCRHSAKKSDSLNALKLSTSTVYLLARVVDFTHLGGGKICVKMSRIMEPELPVPQHYKGLPCDTVRRSTYCTYCTYCWISGSCHRTTNLGRKMYLYTGELSGCVPRPSIG